MFLQSSPFEAECHGELVRRISEFALLVEPSNDHFRPYEHQKAAWNALDKHFLERGKPLAFCRDPWRWQNSYRLALALVIASARLGPRSSAVANPPPKPSYSGVQLFRATLRIWPSRRSTSDSSLSPVRTIPGRWCRLVTTSCFPPYKAPLVPRNRRDQSHARSVP